MIGSWRISAAMNKLLLATAKAGHTDGILTSFGKEHRIYAV